MDCGFCKCTHQFSQAETGRVRFLRSVETLFARGFALELAIMVAPIDVTCNSLLGLLWKILSCVIAMRNSAPVRCVEYKH